jgi:RHS repeat-associated protein
MSITGTETNNIRFPGQYFDQETGLHQNWHRDYKAEIGRYISEDPIGLDRGSINLYSYADNDPVNLVDPMGLTPTCPRWTSWPVKARDDSRGAVYKGEGKCVLTKTEKLECPCRLKCYYHCTVKVKRGKKNVRLSEYDSSIIITCEMGEWLYNH